MTASVRRPVSVLALPVLLLGVFLVPISIAGVATALPSIARDLGSDAVPLQGVVNGFNAAFALFTLVWGLVSDRIGYRTTWLIGLGGSIVALAFCALAPSLAALDLGRVLAGVFAAAIGTATPAIISGAYDGAARSRGFALFGTALGLGLALGPAISGGLTAAFGWRGVFIVFAALMLVALGFGAAVPAIRHERRAGAKTFDLRLLRNARFLSAVLMPVIQAFGYITLLTYLPVALSSVYGLTPGQLAVTMIALTIGALLGPLAGVRIVSRTRIGVHGVYYAAIALMLLGNAGMILIAASVPLAILLIPMTLLGFSFGLPLGLIDGAALEAVPPASSGAASGLLQFARLGSEAIVIGAYAAVVGLLIADRVPDPSLAEQIAAGLPRHASDYVPAFVVGQIAILVAVLIGLVATLALHRVVRRSHRR